ncbi:TlpA family protein disulfide reductase [Aquiflexum lacus]|uniref:TlpA family protein disulfide reductase n=1 Tax=Aquiflexum lacus TaxID=2483805 RepID=UPI0018948F7C|nr:TlpA disulfide reductase family protein [Aquiflexum lacus]
MKLFIKYCFLALLCLYRSHPTTTPFSGQGATPPTLQGLKAVAYIGSRYPCLLAKLLNLSHLMIIVRQTFQFPFPPSHTFLPRAKSQFSQFPSWLPDTRDRTLVLVSCFSYLISHISNLFSRFSLLASLTLLLLAPKVALTQSTGVLSFDPAPVVIYGEVESYHRVDSINIYLHHNLLNSNNNIPKGLVKSIKLQEGKIFEGTKNKKTFQFTSDLQHESGLLSIQVEGYYPIQRLRVYRGDTIRVRIDRNKNMVFFNGPYADKYTCQYLTTYLVEQARLEANPIMWVKDKESFLENEGIVQQISDADNAIRKTHLISSDQESINIIRDFLKKEPFQNPSWKVMESYSDRLENEIHQQLSADLYGKIASSSTKKALTYSRFFPENASLLADLLPHTIEEGKLFGDSIYSFEFAEYLYELARFNTLVHQGSFYEQVSELPQAIKEVVIGMYLIENISIVSEPGFRDSPLYTELISDWLIQEVDYILDHMSVGSKLSSEILLDLKGDEVILDKYQGKVLLLDFWFTGCRACLELYSKIISPLKKHYYDDHDVKFVSISVDKDPTSWAKSIESGKYTSPQAINLNTRGLEHPFLEHYKIRSFPTVYLVNAHGQLVKTRDFPKDVQSFINLIESTKTQN